MSLVLEYTLFKRIKPGVCHFESFNSIRKAFVYKEFSQFRIIGRIDKDE